MFLYCTMHREDGEDFKGGLEQGRLKLTKQLISLIRNRIETVRVWAQAHPSLDEARFTDYSVLFGTSNAEVTDSYEWDGEVKKGVRFKQESVEGDKLVVFTTGDFQWVVRPSGCDIYVETPIVSVQGLDQWEQWLTERRR